MTYYIGNISYDADYLEHYGVKGQKWGLRQWQNPDGTLTEAGKEHYYGHSPEEREAKKAEILRSGTAEEVQLYKHELTAKEFQDVLTRLRNEKSLDDLTPKEKSKAEKLSKAFHNGINFLNTTLGAINTVLQLKKIFLGDDNKDSELKQETKSYMKDLASKYLLNIEEQITNSPDSIPDVKQLSEYMGILNSMGKLASNL